MPRPVGLNHVAVEVTSIDEALAFFEQLFGELTLRGRSRSMAFVDLGDQFIALSAGRQQPPDAERHIGLVVDGREETLERARAAGATMIGDNDFLDPSGNHWQIVDYGDVQFTKTPRILDGMGLSDLEKSERALDELRAKGLAD
jgi:catechol 2,3-dioxygenase-like lactoylglutathione lyase family enzyme